MHCQDITKAPLYHPECWARLLTEIADQIQHATNAQMAADTIVRAGQQLGFARARLWLLRERNRVLVGASHVGDEGLDGFVGCRMPVGDSPYTQRILAAREPCIYHGEQLGPWMLPRHFPTANFVPPTYDWVHLPLWTAAGYWGVLTLDNADQPCQINTEQRHVLRLFARQVATALDYVHLAEQRAREQLTRRWLHQLAGITQELQRAASIDEIANLIVCSGQTFNFDRARLWLQSDDNAAMVGVRQLGNAGLADFAGFRLECATSPYIQRALKERKPVLFFGDELGPLSMPGRFGHAGYRSPKGQWISVPLMLDHEHCLGLLTLDTCQVEPKLTPTHLDVLDLLGRHAAAALERGRQNYEAHWLETLDKLEAACQGWHTVQDMADLIVSYSRQLGFARVRLWHYDESGNTLVGLSQLGDYCPSFQSIWIQLVASSYGRWQPGWREPIFYSGLPEQQSYLDFFFEEQGITPPYGEWVSVPLWAGELFLGVLELDDAERLRSLYPAQRRLLGFLGHKAANALERARSYEQEQRRDEELSSKNRELAWLNSIIEVASQAQLAHTLRAVADTITLAGTRLGFGRARLWLLREDGAVIECISQAGDSPHLIGFNLPLAQAVYASEILRARTPQVLVRHTNHPAYSDQHASALQFNPPIGRWVAIPLRSGTQRPLGMLVLNHTDETQTLTPEQERLLQIFGHYAEVALERARLDETERQQRFERDWLQALAEMAVETQKIQQLDQLSQMVVRQGCKLGFERARFWQLRGDALVGVATNEANLDSHFSRMRLPLDDLSYSQQLFAARQIAIYQDSALRPQRFDQHARFHGWRPPDGWVEIPLYGGAEQPWGLLTLDGPSDARLLHPEQHSLLTLFQQLLDAALQRAQLHEQRSAMLTHSQEIGFSLAGQRRSHDEQENLQQIVDAARRVLGADIVLLYPYDTTTRTLQKPIIGGDLWERDKPLVLPNQSNNIVWNIFRDGQPHFSVHPQHDPHLTGLPEHEAEPGRRPFAVRQGIQAFAGIPLIAHGHPLGVLCVNYRSPKDFSNTYDRTAIQLFANQASLVLANTQLSRMEERERLRRDLHDTVQLSLSTLQGYCKAAIKASKVNDQERTQYLLHQAQRVGWAIHTDFQIILLERMPNNDNASLEKLIRRRLSTIAINECTLDLKIDRQLPALPMMLIRALLYLLPEAAVNTIEHGKANHLRIQIRSTARRLRLKVADNGSGFHYTGSAAKSNHGLRHMRARADEIGGMLRIHSVMDYGTTLRFDLPQRENQPGLRLAAGNWRRASARAILAARQWEWQCYCLKRQLS